MHFKVNHNNSFLVYDKKKVSVCYKDLLWRKPYHHLLYVHIHLVFSKTIWINYVFFKLL